VNRECEPKPPQSLSGMKTHFSRNAVREDAGPTSVVEGTYRYCSNNRLCDQNSASPVEEKTGQLRLRVNMYVTEVEVMDKKDWFVRILSQTTAALGLVF